ncbi:MAG TPA: ParB N-terminal domain-containing protein [Bryobacteraceae bacterium]|jgi:hypothetical protein|nr:ParB N-terminal domain-containing protein [Bryobacteraceae bacterium]
MSDFTVCWRPSDKVIPYAKNSRKIPERAADQVAASIKELGWRAPIDVEKHGVIICGHARLLAAKKVGGRKRGELVHEVFLGRRSTRARFWSLFPDALHPIAGFVLHGLYGDGVLWRRSRESRGAS